MSADSSANPYLTPGHDIVTPLPWSERATMDYVRSVKFIFENGNWFLNVLFIAISLIVGSFIPVLPTLVVLGYQCEMFEALLLRPRETYPDFKMERIMDYLVRGLWPFVIVLVGMVVTVPVLLLVIGLPGLATGLLASAAGEDGAPVVMFVMVPLIVVLAIGTAVMLQVALVPFLLRSVLTQDIGASFDFQFAKDFVQRMWKETVIAGLFLVAVAFASQLIGMLLLCVGVLITIPIVYFTQAHLGMQLYSVYLARGGQKIPIKGTKGT